MRYAIDFLSTTFSTSVILEVVEVGLTGVHTRPERFSSASMTMLMAGNEVQEVYHTKESAGWWLRSRYLDIMFYRRGGSVAVIFLYMHWRYSERARFTSIFC